MLDWLLMATGFTGAFTLMFFCRSIARWFTPTPAHSVHFSPKGGCTDVVVSEIQSARFEVLVLAYSFTSKPIAQALVEAKKRGIQVEIVLDHSNETESYSDLHFFIDEGLAPTIDPHHAIAHNKIMIIDRRTVITGSFNFTNQAENENAENLLVLKNYPDLARAYRLNFTAHKEHARAPEVKAKPAAEPSRAAGRHAA
jgi:phosphatidylserine/phosphatidylglycerophosphate/cardiolipin synthase-like enzyme